MKDEQTFLSEQFIEESILWWSKPSLKHTFRAEKTMIISWMSMLFFLPIACMLPPDGMKGFLIRFFIFSPIEICIIYQLFRWPIRKKNTFFVLTDKRAVILYRKNRKWNEITKSYDIMFHCDIQRKKKCCHIDLGDYRYSIDNSPYNYKTRKYESIEYKFNTKQFEEYTKHFIYDEKYFCFFDLTDCSVPVGIIRGHMMNHKKQCEDFDTN